MTTGCSRAGRRGLLQLPWGKMFYTDVGPPECEYPLLLLHGLFVTHYTFRHLVSCISERVRVVMLDFPGCGESDRPLPKDVEDYGIRWLAGVVESALDALRIPKLIALGHGLGGVVGINLAVASERVERLVLVAPPCFAAPLPAFERMMSVPVLGRALFKKGFGRPQLRWYLQRCLTVPESLDETALNVYWDRLGRAGGHEAAWAMLTQLEHLEYVRDLLPKVSCESLLVWGDDDRVVPVGAADRVSALLPHSQLEILEGCGHAVQEERPEVLAHLVEEFCQGGSC